MNEHSGTRAHDWEAAEGRGALCLICLSAVLCGIVVLVAAMGRFHGLRTQAPNVAAMQANAAK